MLEGSFRDFLDSVSGERSEKKNTIDLLHLIFFQPVNKYSLKIIDSGALVREALVAEHHG